MPFVDNEFFSMTLAALTRVVWCQGFNKHKALMLHKLKEQAKAQMQMKHYAEPTAARRLWPGV